MKSTKAKPTQSSLEDLVKTSFVADQGDGNVLVESQSEWTGTDDFNRAHNQAIDAHSTRLAHCVLTFSVPARHLSTMERTHAKFRLRKQSTMANRSSRFCFPNTIERLPWPTLRAHAVALRRVILGRVVLFRRRQGRATHQEETSGAIA